VLQLHLPQPMTNAPPPWPDQGCGNAGRGVSQHRSSRPGFSGGAGEVAEGGSEDIQKRVAAGRSLEQTQERIGNDRAKNSRQFLH